MNKVYLIQGGALEDYLNKSSGNSRTPRNGNPRLCEEICANASPNSAAYEACGCGDQPPAANIDDFAPLMLLAGAVLLIIAVRSRIKNKLNQ